MSADDTTLSASPAWRLLGLRVVEAGDGRALVAMQASAQLTNFVGVVHGGFLAMLADSAMGRALRTSVPPAARHFTIDLKMNFINAARPSDDLRAAGRVVHAGRRTGFCDCRITGPDDLLVATATATFAINFPS